MNLWCGAHICHDFVISRSSRPLNFVMASKLPTLNLSWFMIIVDSWNNFIFINCFCLGRGRRKGGRRWLLEVGGRSAILTKNVKG